MAIICSCARCNYIRNPPTPKALTPTMEQILKEAFEKLSKK